MEKITQIRGKGAVFIRGFLEDDSPKLRDRQNAGFKAVEELGGTISVPYISKLSKLMESLGVIKKERVGRSYNVSVNEDKAELILSDESYGYSVLIEISTESIITRSAFADYLDKHKMVRVTHELRLPKDAFSLAMERYNRGELEMVFAEPKKVDQLKDKKGRTPQVWKP